MCTIRALTAPLVMNRGPSSMQITSEVSNDWGHKKKIYRRLGGLEFDLDKFLAFTK